MTLTEIEYLIENKKLQKASSNDSQEKYALAAEIAALEKQRLQMMLASLGDRYQDWKSEADDTVEKTQSPSKSPSM